MSATLRAILERYPASSRPSSEPTALGNAGGFSGSRLWRFPSSRGRLVLRAWPTDGPDRSSLTAIHSVLIGAADLGFLPSPIRAIDGSTFVEASQTFWELTPWLPGKPDLARPPEPGRLRAMFAGLAKFHSRVGSIGVAGPSPGLISRSSDLQSLIQGEFDELQAATDQTPLDPRSVMTRQWIDQARPVALQWLGPLRLAASRPVRLQTCLRDVRPDHFLFEGEKLTGLVDFGAMGRDTVAGDLARLIAQSSGTDLFSRTQALIAYESIRPLRPNELALIQDFERANAILGVGRWARWHFKDRRVFDDPRAVFEGLRKGLERWDEQRFLRTQA